MILQVIATIMGVVMSLGYFPQAYKIIRTKDTRSISLLMYIILISGISLWVVYGVIKNDIPVIFANTVTLIPAIVILVMKILYRNK